jgi:hypothetical protein
MDSGSASAINMNLNMSSRLADQILRMTAANPAGTRNRKVERPFQAPIVRAARELISALLLAQEESHAHHVNNRVRGLIAVRAGRLSYRPPNLPRVRTQLKRKAHGVVYEKDTY